MKEKQQETDFKHTHTGSKLNAHSCGRTARHARHGHGTLLPGLPTTLSQPGLSTIFSQPPLLPLLSLGCVPHLFCFTDLLPLPSHKHIISPSSVLLGSQIPGYTLGNPLPRQHHLLAVKRHLFLNSLDDPVGPTRTEMRYTLVSSDALVPKMAVIHLMGVFMTRQCVDRLPPPAWSGRSLFETRVDWPDTDPSWSNART